MNVNKPDTEELLTVRMPKELVAFIGKNDKLGQVLGKVAIEMLETKEKLKTLDYLLTHPLEYFKKYQVSGTDEELTEFCSNIRGTENILHFKNLPTGAHKEIMEEIKKTTPVAMTTISDPVIMDDTNKG